MPVKKWFRKLQPVQLYVVLTLTILFFITELIVSHLTHALTLLMDSYHMLCNIFALTGCIITIKYGSQSTEKPAIDNKLSESTTTIEKITLSTKDKMSKKNPLSQTKQERKLRNTFGWTRIDVITMLICCVFLASFVFSIYVEALQTLAHIDHQDEMHHPISVLCIGAAGLLLNGLCYLLIGGYTFHQGSFLYVTESGDVILNKVVVNESVSRGERRLSRTRNIFSSPPKKRQGIWEMTRDVIGCVVVMVCAIIVIFTDADKAKYVDPLMSLLSATCIMTLSYPYIKESCLILLQTIPDTINIDSLKSEMVNHFPDIINVHDFHVWQLTASKVISTVHIIFENPKVYRNIMEDIKEFLLENGVTQVTIQPEFFRKSTSTDSLNSGKIPPMCLVACQGEECKLNHCCPMYQELSKFKSPSKEILPTPENSTPTLKSVRIFDDELPSLRGSVSSYSINSIESTEHIKTSNEIKYIEKTIKEEEDGREESSVEKQRFEEKPLVEKRQTSLIANDIVTLESKEHASLSNKKDIIAAKDLVLAQNVDASSEKESISLSQEPKSEDKSDIHINHINSEEANK